MSFDILNYQRASMYEVLMKRAYRTAERNHAKGIDDSIYRHLYYIPNGFSLTEKNYDKQLEKVKRFLLIAIDRFLRFRLTSKEEREILQFREILLHSYDEDVVYDCIVNLIEATQRFK